MLKFKNVKTKDNMMVTAKSMYDLAGKSMKEYDPYIISDISSPKCIARLIDIAFLVNLLDTKESKELTASMYGAAIGLVINGPIASKTIKCYKTKKYRDIDNYEFINDQYAIVSKIKFNARREMKDILDMFDIEVVNKKSFKKFHKEVLNNLDNEMFYIIEDLYQRNLNR